MTTVSGPPATTTTLTSLGGYTAYSDTYGPDGAFGPLPATGTAVGAGLGRRTSLGDYTTGAVHNGSDNRGMDVLGGLASALGGQDVHGLEFTGAEEEAIQFAGTIGIDDNDGPWTGEDGKQPSAWQSHPSTIGYVRGNQSTGTSAGTAGALMDSGTRDGTPADELARLSNNGTELNPTSAQPGPTPRAEQVGGDNHWDEGSDNPGDPESTDNGGGDDEDAGGNPVVTNLLLLNPDQDLPIEAKPFNPMVGGRGVVVSNCSMPSKAENPMYNDPMLEALANGSGWGPINGFLEWAVGSPNPGKSSTPAPTPAPGLNVGGQSGQQIAQSPPAANPPAAPNGGSPVGQVAGAAVDAGTGVINGFVDSFIEPFGGKVNRGPIFGNDGAFANGVTAGKWLGLGAQVALFVAGVVGLAVTLPALATAGGAVALAGVGVLATGAVIAAALPVAASGAAALGGLYLAMSNVKDLANQGGGGDNGDAPAKLAFNTGSEAETHLANMFPGGQPQVQFKTGVGTGAQRFRYVDVLDNGIAHESKIGYTKLGNFQAKQIAKDAWLLKNRIVNGVTWHFFRSAETDGIGASQELLQALEKNGIKYVIHE